MNNKLPISRFDGYSDSEASKKKILTDVFQDGDVYFNSGDLLRRDWFGFFFWSDRVGDTFRWKGENVATTEVSLPASPPLTLRLGGKCPQLHSLHR